MLNEIDKNRESVAKVLLEDSELKLQLVKAVQETIDEGLIWKPLSITGAWLTYSNGYHEPSYAVSSSKRVHFRGLVKSAGPAPSQSIRKEILIAQLPDDLAPSHRVLLSTLSGGNIASRVDVKPDAKLLFMEGQLGWLSLDNLSYSVANTSE